QFISESILLSAISLVMAIILVELALPVWSNYVGIQNNIDYGSPQVILSLSGLMLFVGFFSGSYPAFLLSSFKPVSVIKGTLHGNSKGSLFRNGLVVFQFSISIFLIIGTFVIYNQLEFIQNIRLGFDEEQIVVVNNPRFLGEQTDVFRENLLQNPEIYNVSLSSTIPGRRHRNLGSKPEGKKSMTLDMCTTDEDFLKTMKIEMIQGKYFSKEFPSNSTSIIINESAVKLIGWDDPIGKSIRLLRMVEFTVIGVIKDYHYKSVHQEVRPMGLLHTSADRNASAPRYISIKINADNVRGTLEFNEKTWDELAPDRPYEYSFLDEDYNSLYDSEKQIGEVFTFFSILTIFIASLGLFGLASFIAEQRTKEMGVRKVLGATVMNIVQQLSKGFLFPIIISNFIAWPLGWIFMSRWLESFAYRTSLDISIFALSGLTAFIIALTTICIQTIRAAFANPVDSLRHE
ncbi:MAG: hypothetical protein GY863_16700, partial [bacterium]|nr:hypothetical protein [bacterium]